VTPSDPEFLPDELAERGRAERSSGGERMPDPWGVKRAENLLTSLQGVLSARVEVSPVGDVLAVHVLTNAGVSAKQMVRNVESALLAQLGLKVDHRKISVAQTAEVRPIEALEQTAVRQEARRRMVVFRELQVTSAGANRVSVKVTLWVGGEEESASEEVAATGKARLMGAARATLKLLERLVEHGTMELEGVKVVNELDTQLVLAAVQVVEGRKTMRVIGAAEVGDDPEQGAVLAVLDATNRWMLSRA
jgi:hypothetical protein